MGIDFVNKCDILTSEMNFTSQIEPFYWLAINSAREYMHDPEMPIFH